MIMSLLSHSNIDVGTGRCPVLHFAIELGNDFVFDKLLFAPNLLAPNLLVNKDISGRTAFHFAVLHNEHMKARMLLLRPHVDFKTVDSDGSTPISLIKEKYRVAKASNDLRQAAHMHTLMLIVLQCEASRYRRISDIASYWFKLGADRCHKPGATGYLETAESFESKRQRTDGP